MAQSSIWKRLYCLSLLLAALLAACGGGGSDSPSAPEEETVKLGLLTTLTGALSREGPSWRATAEMALTEINAAGGVLGRRVELVVGDTGTDPEQAVAAAARLRDEGVAAFIGPIISSATLRVAAEVAVPAGLPLVSPASTAPEISGLEDDGLVWRTAVSDAFKGEIVARYAYRTGSRRAGIIHLDSDFGRGLASRFTAAFTALGGEVVNTVPFPELSGDEIETFDYRPAIDDVMLGEPDLIYIISFTEDGVKISIAADGKVSDAYRPRFASEISPSESLLSVIGIYEGLFGLQQEAPDTPNNTAFFEAYRARYDSDPEIFAEAVYGGIYLWALAAQQAGSVAGPQVAAQLQAVSSGGEKINVGEFAAGLEALGQGLDIDYEGATGSIDFDANGDVSSGTFNVWQILDGAFADIETITFP